MDTKMSSEIIALLQEIYKEIDEQKSIDDFSLNGTYTVDINTINEIFNTKIQEILGNVKREIEINEGENEK